MDAASVETAGSGVQPFYFGPPGSELFGVFESAAGEAGRARDCGVLICQPVGQEYVRCHRALRLLARRLVEAGFPVLRFDFFGCGDSAGESDEARLARWVADVSAAAGQLRARCAPARLAVVGVRLGASVAWRAGAGPLEVDRLVLWEPVVSGAEHVRELDAQHAALAAGPAHGAGGEVESLGFVYSRELLADLSGLALDAAAGDAPARRVLILEQEPAQSGTEDAPEPAGATRHGTAERVECRRVTGTRFWLDEPFQAVMPEAGIREAIAWLSRWA